MDTKINDILYDLWRKSGFVASQKLYQLAKSKDLSFTRSQINEFLEKQKTAQQTKVIKKVARNPIVAPYAGFELQMDLLDMTKFANNNRGYKWILLVIDIFSRKLEALPIKSKSISKIMIWLKEINI